MTVSAITTNGYADSDVNGVVHRYAAIVSRTISGTLYQVYGFWDKDGHLNFAIRAGAGAWTIYDFNTITIADTDDHRIISIGIDTDGYIHVCYGMHAGSLLYRRSADPLPSFIGNLTVVLSMLGTNETSVTYPTFFSDPAGKLYFIFRAGTATNGSIYFYSYTTATTTWAAAAGTGTAGLLVQGAANLSSYWGQPAFDSDFGLGGRMHLFWIWADSTTTEYRDLSYVAWDGTDFHKSDGTAQTVPITDANEETIDDGAGVGWYRITQLNPAASDSSGRPHCAYGKTGADSKHHLYHIWHNGATWVIAQLTATALDPATQNIWPDMVIDRRVNIVHILYRDPLDGSSSVGLLMQSSAAGDYTSWAKSVLYSTDIGDYSTAAYSMPKLDVYEWENYYNLHVVIENWFSGQSSLPIYLLEYTPAAPTGSYLKSGASLLKSGASFLTN